MTTIVMVIFDFKPFLNYKVVITMSLIPYDELSVLLPASEVCEVADSAHIDLQLIEVARLINTNANAHSYSCEFAGKLYDENKTELESKGYICKEITDGAYVVTRIYFKSKSGGGESETS